MLRLLSISSTDSNWRRNDVHSAIAHVGGQVKTEEGVSVPEVAAGLSVSQVLPHLTGRWELVHVATDETYTATELMSLLLAWDGFCRTYRSTLRYRCSTAPDVSAGCRGTGSRACSIEYLLKWSTPCSRRTASDTWPFSSRGSWCAPSVRSDSGRPSLRIRWHWWCLFCNWGWPRQPWAQTPSCFAPWHRRIHQEFILQEQVHVETAHHVDDKTPHDVRSSSHEPCISCRSVGDLDGIHASGLVLVPQLTRQLCDFGVVAVTQQRLYVGAIRIRVGRTGHQRTVQVDVDLTEQRMQPVIHRTHGIDQVEVTFVGSGHLCLNVYQRVGEIQVIVSRSGYQELYRSTESREAMGWCSTIWLSIMLLNGFGADSGPTLVDHE